MKVKLFNSEVELQDHHCNFYDGISIPIKEPYVNLYVRITDVCQAKCEFCEFHGEDKVEFDFYKFMYTFNKLNRQIKINKVSFTGGEPTLKIDLLNRLLKEIKEANESIFTIVNTNGYAFENINPDYVDSIALSRHHFSDTPNKKTFGTSTVPNTDDLLVYPYKEKLHLSCNLIRGKIDTQDKCHTYIEEAGRLGITDVGFVSLMSVNDYATEHLVDFEEINLEGMPNTLKNQHWSKKCGDKPVCKCANFLTSTVNGTIVKSYARYYSSREECKGMLVYEVNGDLKAGFNGKVINA